MWNVTCDDVNRFGSFWFSSFENENKAEKLKFQCMIPVELIYKMCDFPGCEMMYVIDQRLKAQGISLEKSAQGTWL